MFKPQENIKIYVDRRRSGVFWLRIQVMGALMNMAMNTKLAKEKFSNTF